MQRTSTTGSDSYTLDNIMTEVMRLSDVEATDTVDVKSDLPFFVNDEFTDITLIVEDKELYTNRCLLAYASPVFACMFTAEFREKNERVVTLPGKELAAICDLLSFLHPGVNFTMTTDSAFRLMPLAEEYQIQILKVACEAELIDGIARTEHPNVKYLLRCAELGERCSLPNLLNTAADELSDPDVPLKCIKDCFSISLETKARIYETKVEKLQKRNASHEIWKHRACIVKNRLKDIIAPHDEHCRCRVEVKLRNSLQRSCQYCSRPWCFDNISTDAYKNSYLFYCNHKIGYHIIHDAAVRSFLEQVD